MENLNKTSNSLCLASCGGEGDVVSDQCLIWKAQSLPCFLWARRDRKVVKEQNDVLKSVF